MILEYGMLYGVEDLTKKCLKYIQRYTAQVLNSDAFVRVSPETLETIFSLDSLSVCEDTMVTELLRWAETKVNDRAEAGESHEHTQVGSVFNGILDKIRVKSLTENKIQELLESENDLAVQLAFMVCVMKERLSSDDEDSDSDVNTRKELPTGKVTCDVVASSSTLLVYNGRACPPLVVETSESIAIHKIDLLDRPHSNATRVIVSVTQDDVPLLNYEMQCNMCRKTSELGPIFSLTFPQPIQIEEGQFKIQARFKISHGSYGSVQVGVPKSPKENFGGLDFSFPNTSTSTPIASFEASVA